MRVALVILIAACGGGGVVSPAPPPVTKVEVKKLELTWLVYPAKPAPHDLDSSPLALLVGNRRIELASQLGELAAYNQSTCATAPRPSGSPLGPDEVAKITFFNTYEHYPSGYVVKRHPQHGLVVFEWSQHRCEDATAMEHGACPVTLSAPRPLEADALEVVQHIVLVDDSGKQLPFDCGVPE